MRERSVVLLSGGLDSAANLAFCRLRDEPILALTVNYGQRAASAEIRAAEALPVQNAECRARIQELVVASVAAQGAADTSGTR